MTNPPLHRGHPYFPGYFWDHYTEHPDIYDEFAKSTDAGVDFLSTLIPISGLSILDIAAGTGRTAFSLARRARYVLGVEPDQTMREFAQRKSVELGSTNVEFIDGSTYEMPSLEPQSFDLVTCFHGPPFSPKEIGPFVEAFKRLTRPGGTLAVQTTIPQWMHEFQRRLPADSNIRLVVSDSNRVMEHAFVESGFRFVDATLHADHGTLECALASYGFIYGPHAIDWLLDSQQAEIPWGIRTYLCTV